MDVDRHRSCGETIGSDAVEERAEDEILSRILCRLSELKRIGCDQPDCVVLAGRLDVSLDRALELVGRGCPPGLAVRILL
jgi:hypothetical protein